jgi:DNA-binding transcriptional LysR family regulator
MNADDLRYFVAAAQEGNIFRAAGRLGITQPAVSKAIARLEARLRLSLFERKARGVELTEAGIAFLPRAVAITNSIQDSLDAMRDIRQGHSGRVRFGIGSGVPGKLLTSVCKALVANGDIRLELSSGMTSSLTEALVLGRLDFIVSGVAQTDNPELVWRGLFDDPMVVLAPRDSALARRMSANDWSALSKQRWILPVLGTQSRSVFSAQFTALGLEPPNPVVESNASGREIELALALNALLLAPTSLSLYEPSVAERFVVLEPPADWHWKRQVSLLFRRYANLSPAARLAMEQFEVHSKAFSLPNQSE